MPNGIERSFSSRSRSAASLVQSVFMAASLDDCLATTLISARLVDEREQSRAVSRRTSRPAALFQNILAARAARPRARRSGCTARRAYGSADRSAGREPPSVFPAARQLAAGRRRRFFTPGTRLCALGRRRNGATSRYFADIDYRNVSSSALADFRSTVSKPSVKRLKTGWRIPTASAERP